MKNLKLRLKKENIKIDMMFLKLNFIKSSERLLKIIQKQIKLYFD